MGFELMIEFMNNERKSRTYTPKKPKQPPNPRKKLGKPQ